MSLVPQALSADHFVTRVSSTPAASNRYMRSMASRLGRQEHSCMECNDRCRDFRFAKAGLRGVSTAAFSPAEGHIAMALEDAQRASGMLGAPKRLQFCSDTWPKSGRQTTTSMACASSPRHQTKRPAFGIPLREGRSRRCADTRVQYCRPLSTWTDRASSRRQKTRRPVFGTPRQEGRSRRIRGHEGSILSAAFSHDGSRVVTASSDKTARTWNVRAATLPTNELTPRSACVDCAD